MSNGVIQGTISNAADVTGSVKSSGTLGGKINPSKKITGNIMETVLRGLSVYEIAVKNGYTGTEEEWLATLIGNGIESVNMDSDGYLTIYFTDNTSYTSPISLKGLSSYEIAVENGFEGTVNDWIDSLNATVELGTVTTGDTISITNSGTNKDAVFDFVLPKHTIDSLSQDEVVVLYCGSATEVT